MDNVLYFDIRRDFVVVDGMREYHKKKFSPNRFIKVIIYKCIRMCHIVFAC